MAMGPQKTQTAPEMGIREGWASECGEIRKSKSEL